MLYPKRIAACPCWLLAAATFVTVNVNVVDALSSSSSPKPKPKPNRPIVSLSGSGDVSGFLYGKLQRATSLYGSGLVGPATAVVHGDRDLVELGGNRNSRNVADQTQQRKDLDRLLWNRFGMATCEGVVEREDLLTKPSYLKPRLSELQNTLVFLDATTRGMKTKRSGASGAGASAGASASTTNAGTIAAAGLGDLLSGLWGGPKQKKSSLPLPLPANKKKSKQCWLDVDLVKSAIAGGSRVFVVCESKDTAYIARTLNKCLSSIPTSTSTSTTTETETEASGSIVTIVSPEDNVILGGSSSDDGYDTDEADASWKSLRPQDLEGELLQAVSVRNASKDFESPAATTNEHERKRNDKRNDDTKTPATTKTPADNGSKARLAAASAEYIAPPAKKNNKQNQKQKQQHPKGTLLSLSRHDLAEVCVQCALRLPTTTAATGTGTATKTNHQLRVVRVIPCGTGNDSDQNTRQTQQDPNNNNEWTERPNQNYFSMMGGKQTKGREGVVASVNWVKTLEPMVLPGGNAAAAAADNTGTGISTAVNGETGGVIAFPKRPSAM
uniref:Uncharacterized protein n=1 Tax=Pseudo-nitzschia australis TaxID=44445 RepID=A0A7S4EK86_9STRA|mmetsp:Transcript_7924/g.17679  ORF Transcript_7924/g.17679 Transcript_7924/m.17679 type:complete len:556 (-) Transcript_7924:1663-3330(-)